jgi:ribosomal protein S18 acetylase RimI-like enzyme
MRIALASPADVPALVNLINSAYRGDSSRQGWTTEADLLAGIRTDEAMLNDLLQTKDSVILRYNDEAGNLAGSVCLQRNDHKIYLGMLTVSPTLQDRGIGKKLLQAADEYAKQQHCNAIFMTVISVRSELIAWYERHGYKRTGETKPFPTDSRFGMTTQQLEFVVLEKELGNTK